ncbi:MAG: DUF255 domain-containing protein [Myxococcota bacterium]|nr:DUF255 domain-containing protein [Myxococcota bacterium]
MISRSFALALLMVSCTSDGEPRGPARLAAEPEASMRATAVIRREGNHLRGEPSPYLLQHAHNPVDWYPWGEEALSRARREDRPIFLSIGYSTCHWCHVMEEESFEDDEVARFLNEHFVSIKVDREQRPDLDALFLEAVRRLGGSTGWPLTVFLTPDGVPFFGDTYFPRHGAGRRPGFLDVLREVARRYREDDDVAAQGRLVFEAIERAARPPSTGDRAVDARTLDLAMTRLAGARDPELGGFGRRQKFPNAPLLLAEVRHVARTDDAETRAHLVLTLEQAMRGGVRDHLAGTFHRYAVDRRWHVPHFEETLYDNAQLAQVYVEAGRLLGRDDFVRVGRAVLDDLIAGWQREDGGFVVGFDADDPGGRASTTRGRRPSSRRRSGPRTRARSRPSSGSPPLASRCSGGAACCTGSTTRRRARASTGAPPSSTRSSPASPRACDRSAIAAPRRSWTTRSSPRGTASPSSRSRT